MKISLLVLRCRDLEMSKRFYEQLGFNFVEEKHKSGPRHYCSQDAGFVFELYPLGRNEAADSTRLGFFVNNVPTVRSRLPTMEEYEFCGRQIYVVQDPDGRKVEINELPLT